MGKQQGDAIEEEYVYDPQGHIVSAHNASTALLRAELYLGGRHVATYNPNGTYGPWFWNHSEWLGTERVRTDSTGTAREWCTDTPYGMNVNCVMSQGLTDTSPMHFTGKQLDAETGNDYFGARYLGTGTNLGRFMTPDWSAQPVPVPFAKLYDPQTLNLYVYLRNNPLNTTDPDGHGDDICSGGSVNGFCHQSAPDKNGNVTVTVNNYTTTTTQNADGTTTTTDTTTTSTYTFDRNGNMTGGQQQTRAFLI